MFMKKSNKEILEEALLNNFFSIEDLRYNKSYGYLLNNKELEDYLIYKDDYQSITKYELNLFSFNSKKIYYYYSNELTNLLDNYILCFKEDISKTNSTIITDNYREMVISRLASELEGTLEIENENTTRTKIIEIIKAEKTVNGNDQIIKNMYNGYLFVKNKPAFTKENLFKLYSLLSENCLNDNQKLKDFYRDDVVYIANHEGCPASKITEAMDSLFVFVNSINNENGLISFYLPFITQYYILYIHPYFDLNGRTARMVSLWISLLSDIDSISPFFISEAINDTKSEYYKALDNSRYSHNDLTYFLTYIMKTSNNYYLVYKNINAINEELQKIGEVLSINEQYYLKRIIINKNKGWFNYRGFTNFCGLDITKQGSLKILNHLLSLDLLVSKINNKKMKIFQINEEKLKYEIK